MCLLALVACGRRDPVPGLDRPRVVVDAVGNAVRLPAVVRRVATTVPGLTETVVALGGRSLLVAVGQADERVPIVQGARRLRTWPEIDAEALAAADPDLILLDATLSPADPAALRRRFAGVFVADSRTLAGVAETFRRLGEALGVPEEGTRLAHDLERAVAAARLALRRRVLLLGQVEPPYALGKGSLLDDVLSAVGAENALPDLAKPSDRISWEQVVEAAPDWIVTADGVPLPAGLRERLRTVPAVSQGRIATAPDDLQRAGPRLAKATLRFARVLAGDLPPSSLEEQGPFVEPSR